MANVSDEKCEERRKDIYCKHGEMKETIDKLVGGITVAKWMIGLGTPIALLLIGGWTKLQIDSVKQMINNHQHPIIYKSDISIKRPGDS